MFYSENFDARSAVFQTVFPRLGFSPIRNYQKKSKFKPTDIRVAINCIKNIINEIIFLVEQIQ